MLLSETLKIFQLIFVLTFFAEVSTRIVETNDGKILGTKMLSRNMKEVDVFLRIPYAQAPIGDLRFKAPLPALPWKGIRDGRFYGDFCFQQGSRSDEWSKDSDSPKPSEDCLFLNVFTMNFPTDDNIKLKPVIVFIHGGGWESGTGNWIQPFYIIDRDVVVVTINYRLGALGFLALGIPEAVGNMALKDQLLALKWTQKNIHFFGGDPKNVMITGSSAGGFSVTAHMVSSMSDGLFHKVLASSGAIAFPKKLQTDQIEAAKKLASILECDTGDISKMLACFMKKPAKDIASVSLRDIRECPLIPWLAVVEPGFGQERFFTMQPADSLRTGNFSRVPLIIGMTQKEFISPTPGILKNGTLMERFNSFFEETAPLCASYEHGTSNSHKISKKFKELYFQNGTIDETSFESLGNMVSDGFISYAVHRFAHLAAKFTDVFYYKFSYVGNSGSFRYPHDKPYDACHGDDQQYVLLYTEIKRSDRDNIMVERLTRIYSQFAWSGTPNNSTDKYLREMNWPKLDAKSEYYMDIGEHFIEKHGFFLDRFRVWDMMIEEQKPVYKHDKLDEAVEIDFIQFRYPYFSLKHFYACISIGPK